MKWGNANLRGYECLDSFEVKYWPRGKASRSFVTSAIQANQENKDRVYSTMLEVDECKEYTYVIRASKSNPSVVVNHRGSFQSKCKRVISNKTSQQERTRTVTTTTKSTTIAPPTTTTTTTPATTSRCRI